MPFVSLATPITNLQLIDGSLIAVEQAGTERTENISPFLLDEVLNESKASDNAEIDNMEQPVIPEPASGKLLADVISTNFGEIADESADMQSVKQIIQAKKKKTEAYIPVKDLTEIELDSGLFYLVEPLLDDPEFKESARQILLTITSIKEALFLDDDIINEYNDTSLLNDRIANRGSNAQRLNNNSGNGQSVKNKANYDDSSVIKEFIDKFKGFAIFLIIVIILIKIIFTVISSREKAIGTL